MNNKSLLLAIFATVFSGMTFVNKASIEIAPQEPVTSINEFAISATADQGPVKIVKKIVDLEIESYCDGNDASLCEQLRALIALTDQIDLDHDLAIIINALKEEINKQKNSTTILEDTSSKTEKTAKEVHTALMIVPQQ